MRRRFLAAALPLLALAACQTPGQQMSGQRTSGPGPADRTVVYFTADSAALDENASALVEEVAERARANPAVPVRVRGFAAPDSGTAAFNRTLAEARAQHVADHLAESGVDRRRIRIESRGAVPFEMMATESRRVEIVLGN